MQLLAADLGDRNGDNPLDNTAVHPESYGIVKTILKDLGVTLEAV